MNSKYLYLLLDISSISIPLLFSFYPKAPFYKNWKYLIISTLIPAILFIAWDILFTRMGVWGFNEKYLTGIFIYNLPIEEVLFFFCIPYACLFTYFALNHLIEKDYLRHYHEVITWILSAVLIILGNVYLHQWYTSVTFILLSLFLIILQQKVRPKYMGRFYISYLIILIPFFIVNGILTGSFIDDPVVWYNNEENLGIRFGTIPIEDVFYGMLLLVINVSLYEWLKSR